jgi:hypothetical protein
MAIVYQTATQNVVTELNQIRTTADGISEDTRLRLEYEITKTVSEVIRAAGLTNQISQKLLTEVINPFKQLHP